MREQKLGYINLSTGEIRKESIPEKMRRMYLGGRGIAMYLLYNHIPAGRVQLAASDMGNLG